MDSIINIDNLNAEIGDNIPSEYLPVKTNYNECNWDIVAGYFIAFAFNLELTKYPKEKFENDCKEAFFAKQITEKHFGVIRKAYFEKENYLKLSPTNLILHTQDDDRIKPKINSASKKVASSLFTLLNSTKIDISNKDNDHFLSEIINSTLKKQLKNKKYNDHAITYLPYLQDRFIHDFKFLASKPSYMLENIGSFLSLYSFLHTSQVALNLKEWRDGLPRSRPLFFVIETEKVSSERTKVINSGWKSFTQASSNLFPMLSTLQLIQAKNSRKPIWQIFAELSSLEDSQKQQCIDSIDNYCKRFVEARKLMKKEFIASDNLDAAFDQLFDLAFAQFDKTYADPSTTRYQANEKVVSALREHTAKGFVKAKGRIGNILVLTQDHLLLLTNVVIGDAKQIRFNDLIEEFKQRGIYFDETSEERLIEFYERIGNVERMSDSGDDLNVRQTA
jgi:DNA phosphorothioation-dependent restriction protein DptG